MMGAFICQSTIITLGVWITPLRMVSLIFQIFCTLALIGVCIMVALFRYNSIGKLAALSMRSSQFSDVDGMAILSDERTFADDGQLIERLWILMLVYIIGQCCLGCFAVAPPTQDTLRKMGVTINEEKDEAGQTLV